MESDSDSSNNDDMEIPNGRNRTTCSQFGRFVVTDSFWIEEMLYCFQSPILPQFSVRKPGGSPHRGSNDMIANQEFATTKY